MFKPTFSRCAAPNDRTMLEEHVLHHQWHLVRRSLMAYGRSSLPGHIALSCSDISKVKCRLAIAFISFGGELGIKGLYRGDH